MLPIKPWCLSLIRWRAQKWKSCEREVYAEYPIPPDVGHFSCNSKTPRRINHSCDSSSAYQHCNISRLHYAPGGERTRTTWVVWDKKLIAVVFITQLPHQACIGAGETEAQNFRDVKRRTPSPERSDKESLNASPCGKKYRKNNVKVGKLSKTTSEVIQLFS